MAENVINLIDIESASSQECDKSNLSKSKLILEIVGNGITLKLLEIKQKLNVNFVTRNIVPKQVLMH
jgi:hypothetical protein